MTTANPRNLGSRDRRPCAIGPITQQPRQDSRTGLAEPENTPVSSDRREFRKRRTSPSAHVLSRLTLNYGMIVMGTSRNWPIGPGQAAQDAAIVQPVHDMLTGKYDDRTVIF